MIQGLVMSDGFWYIISHSYQSLLKSRYNPRIVLRHRRPYHHRIWLSASDYSKIKSSLYA